MTNSRGPSRRKLFFGWGGMLIFSLDSSAFHEREITTSHKLSDEHRCAFISVQSPLILVKITELPHPD